MSISRGSVSAAMDRLCTDGWLVTRRGSGAYVAYRGAYAAQQSGDEHASTGNLPPVPFALGIPPLDVFPKATWTRLQSRRWRAISNAHLQEGAPTGWRGLQDAIAGHLAAWRGLSVAPAQIVVSTCIRALIDLIIRSVGLSGCEAWVESPSYPAWWRTLQNCNLRVQGVPVDAFGLDVSAGIRLSPRAKLALVTPNCQFPTGVAMSAVRRRELLGWAAGEGSWILEDDFDWQQAGSTAPVPLAQADRSRVIYLDTFNYVLFPALRIAYAIIPVALLDQVIAARKGVDGSMNVPDQMILGDFIAGGHLDRHLARLADCRAERGAALRHLLEHDLAEILEPVGSASAHFICRPRVPLSRLLSASWRSRVVVENMADLRLVPEGPDQVMLGYFGFSGAAMAKSAAALRAAVLSSAAA